MSRLYYLRSIKQYLSITTAQWIHLRLPSCGPRFESQAHHLRCYSQILYYVCHCIEKRMKINKKSPGSANILKQDLCSYNKLEKVIKVLLKAPNFASTKNKCQIILCQYYSPSVLNYASNYIIGDISIWSISEIRWDAAKKCAALVHWKGYLNSLK